MPKYIDLNKQLVRLYLLNLTCEDVIKEFLLSAETINVVRCRDCEIYEICNYARGLGANGFCNQGKRREVNDAEVH